MKIGPGDDPSARAEDLMNQARADVRCDEDGRKQSAAIVRRLIIAFVLIMTVGLVFFGVLPKYGLDLPLIMPLLAFAAIAAGTLLNMPKVQKQARADDGRPISCGGPRPLRSFRDDDQ